jgi:hypothetical protein
MDIEIKMGRPLKPLYEVDSKAAHFESQTQRVRHPEKIKSNVKTWSHPRKKLEWMHADPLKERLVSNARDWPSSRRAFNASRSLCELSTCGTRRKIKDKSAEISPLRNPQGSAATQQKQGQIKSARQSGLRFRVNVTLDPHQSIRQ